MCDAPATTREHAPPLCLFPEAATLGRDLRKKLITVPSCDQHNSVKSNDDEFFRATLIALAAEHSQAGQNQLFQKALQGELPDQKLPVQIDRDRFDKCVDHLARALLFHEFGKKWTHRLQIWSPQFVVPKNGVVAPHEPSVNASRLAMRALGMEEFRGENPEVFKYKAWRGSDLRGDFVALEAEFYGLFKAFAICDNRNVTTNAP